MATPLIRRLPRELLHNLGRYLGLFLLIAVSLAFVTGFLVAASSIERIIDGMHDAYSMEDGQFTCAFEAPEVALDKVEGLGVEVYENFSREATLSWGVHGDGTARVFANRTEVNKVAYAQGRAPSETGEIALDRVFCANNDLSLGDVVMVGDDAYELVGICTLPDYSALFEKPTDFVFNALTFTVAQVTQEAFDDLSGSISYTYIYRAHDRELSPAQETDLAQDIVTTLAENGAQPTAVMTSSANQAISYAGADVEGDQLMWEVMMVLIIVIMAFVFVVITGASIEAESAVIGTLLASGYRKRELIGHYLALPALVGIIAALVGNVLGYTLLAAPMRDLYYNSYSLPPYEAFFNVRVFVITTLVPLVLLVGITLVGLMRKLRCSPLEFLRHETSRRSRRRGIALPERLSFTARFRLRVFLCNLPSFVTLFCGIAFASLLLVFGLCLMPVIEHYADNLKSDLVAEHQYMVKVPVAVEDEEAEPYAVKTLEVARPLVESNETVSVYGIEPDSSYWEDLDVAGGRVVAGRGLMSKCALELGQSVTFFDPASDASYEITFDAQTGSASNMSLYMDIEDFNELFGNDAGYFNGYVSDEALDIDEHVLVSDLTPASMDKIIEQMTDSMGSITYLLTLLAVIVYVVLIYLLTKTVIDRAARSISYLKVFGYRDGEIRRLYVRSITITVALSLVLCLPLIVVFLTWLVSFVFMEYNGNFEVIVPASKLVLEVCAGLVCYGIVAIAHVAHVKRIPLAIALKAQE